MKKIFLTAAVFLAAVSGFSQGKVMKPNSFGDNWFLQLQGGGSLTVSESFKDASLGDIISPAAAISLGKYFAPEVGARVQVGGWQSKNYYHSGSIERKFDVKYVQANADALFNLTNIFMPYKADRVFNFIGIAGLGYVHGFKDTKEGLPTSRSIVPRVGFIMDFRLSNHVNFNLEANGNLMHDNFNGIDKGTKYDGTANVLAGLTFKLGKSTWDMVDYVDPSQIDALNAQINSQRADLRSKDSQISQLQSALAEKPKVVVEEKKVVEELEETVMNAVVVFKIGKSDLQDNQEINIYNAAKFFQDHPDMNIVVTGYADKATGNPTLNQKLSERRAEAVAKVLIEKFGIAANRITTQGSGDKVQPFQIDSWNRVAIFTAVPSKK